MYGAGKINFQKHVILGVQRGASSDYTLTSINCLSHLRILGDWNICDEEIYMLPECF